MTNIRRVVLPGDFIFVVSGSVPAVQQYVVGGMEVAERIDPLAAYKRFPEGRLQTGAHGRVEGNVIVDVEGNQHPLDTHKAETFEERIKNFIVGTNPVALEQAGLFGVRKRRSPAHAFFLGRAISFATRTGANPSRSRPPPKDVRKMTGRAFVNLPHTPAMHTAKAHFPTFSAGVQYRSPCSDEYS